MQHNFKEGDKVRLKSGGPIMTIKGIGQYGAGAKDDNALCVWFDGKKKFEDVFEFVTLELADDDPNVPAFGVVPMHRG